jgi:hypothetical protein
MAAGHSDQSGSLPEMDGRNGQSEDAHGEDQAQNIQDQVPNRQKVSSEEDSNRELLSTLVTDAVTNHVRVWPLKTRPSICVEILIFTKGSTKITLRLKCRPSRWRITSIKGTMPS